MDLLFRLPNLGQWDLAKATEGATTAQRRDNLASQTYNEVQFTGPRRVISVQKDVVTELQAHEVRIVSECSLISSGTELKIFHLSFEIFHLPSQPLGFSLAM